MRRPITRHSNRGEATRGQTTEDRTKVLCFMPPVICPSSSVVRRQLRSGEVAQHVMQNAAVPEIFEFVDGIDAAYQRDPLEAAVGRDDLGNHALARLDLAVQPADGD